MEIRLREKDSRIYDVEMEKESSQKANNELRDRLSVLEQKLREKDSKLYELELEKESG